jgi:hypothetical protein
VTVEFLVPKDVCGYSKSSVPFVIFGKKFDLHIFCHFTNNKMDTCVPFLVPAYLNSIFYTVMCAPLCYYAASSGEWCYSEERTSQLLRGGSPNSHIFCIFVPAALSGDNFNCVSDIHAPTIEL